MIDIALAIWFASGVLSLGLCSYALATRLTEFDDDTLGGLFSLFFLGPVGLAVTAGVLWADLHPPTPPTEGDKSREAPNPSTGGPG